MYGLILILGFVLFSMATGSNLPLLSGSLRTFQVHACDGHDLQIECWPDTVVSVYLAQYGRRVPSHQLCPPEEVTEGTLDMLNDTTDCVATHALRTMGESCREQRICKIKTSPQTFGNDPCPGVRKYAEVAYKCRPTVFSNKVVCEGERLRLKCDNNDFRIVIFSASFGATRQGVPECPQPEGEEGKTEDCQVVHATEALMTICHGKRTCTVAADAATFGKMGCPPTTRLFLKVVHTCVPKEILKDQDLGVSEETKDPEGEGGSRGGDYTGFIEEPRYAAPVTPVSSVESSKPPQRAAPTIKPDPGVGVWKVGTTTHMQSDENELNVNSSRYSSGFFAEIFHSIRDNKEKFMLYLTLILSLVVVTTLAVLVTRWKCRRTRRLREASAELEAQKNKMKSPIPSTPPGGEGGISPFGNPTDPFEDPPGSVEIVMFTPRSSFKKALPIEEDDCSFPRAPVATHKNFYYS